MYGYTTSALSAIRGVIIIHELDFLLDVKQKTTTVPKFRLLFSFLKLPDKKNPPFLFVSEEEQKKREFNSPNERKINATLLHSSVLFCRFAGVGCTLCQIFIFSKKKRNTKTIK